MIGAIAGDIIGSVYEPAPIKSTEFPLFQPRSRFTDDSVLTVAIAVLPAVEADDTFTLGADILTVQHAERDAASIAWRVFCRR